MSKETKSLGINRFKFLEDRRLFLRTFKGLVHCLEILKSAFSPINFTKRHLLRRLFEHKRIKVMAGGSLILIILLTSFLTYPESVMASIQPENITLSAGAIELTTTQSLRLPVEIMRVTQKFSFFHRGVDLDGTTGDRIYPIMGGAVESIINDRYGLGKHIIINHGAGLRSIYAHLSVFKVNAGQEVGTNQVVGLMGNTGNSTGDHLHLEVTDNGKYINPLSLLAQPVLTSAK